MARKIGIAGQGGICLDSRVLDESLRDHAYYVGRLRVNRPTRGTKAMATEARMDAFLELHNDHILGVLEGPDRIIIKGYLTPLFGDGSFKAYLSRRGILLKNAKGFLNAETEEICAAAKQMAQKQNRRFVPLEGAHTHKSSESKEDLARKIAKEDGITEGLVCILQAMEVGQSFVVGGNHQTHLLEAVKKKRLCRHLYFYFIDPEFGWMHVRIQTWAPYSLQIYLNGREWLCRQLEAAGIAFERSGNKILWVEDCAKAQKIFSKLMRRRWPSVLDRFAAKINPLMPKLRTTGIKTYHWVMDQSEHATDIMFKSAPYLERLVNDLITASMIALGSKDVYRFLDRKPNGNFKGEVIIDVKRRAEGARLKFQIKRNSTKIYNHLNVLRVETTINNPRDFKVWSRTRGQKTGPRRWCPMGKSVAHFYRMGQVGRGANHRVLDAFATLPLTGKAMNDLNSLCRPHRVKGRRIARFNPVDTATVLLFTAIVAGEFLIRGFRNRELQAKLYAPTSNKAEARRRTHRTSRLIAKLRAHGLIARVPRTRLYRITPKGQRVAFAAIRFWKLDVPALYAEHAKLLETAA